MTKYSIFVGLGGGYGGTRFCQAEEYSSLKEAEEDAYRLAVEEYYSYSGDNSLFNSEEALENDPDLTDEDLAEMEQEDIESWIEFYVKEYEPGDEDK